MHGTDHSHPATKRRPGGHEPAHARAEQLCLAQARQIAVREHTALFPKTCSAMSVTDNSGRACGTSSVRDGQRARAKQVCGLHAMQGRETWSAALLHYAWPGLPLDSSQKKREMLLNFHRMVRRQKEWETAASNILPAVHQASAVFI